MQDILLVGLGGFGGANARYWLGSLFNRRFGTAFPFGTLFINVSGSFILGWFLGLTSHGLLTDPAFRWLIAVGFCGGYTTFSTFTYETLLLLQAGRFWRAVGFNLLGSYLSGLAAAAVGLWLGGW